MRSINLCWLQAATVAPQIHALHLYISFCLQVSTVSCNDTISRNCRRHMVVACVRVGGGNIEFDEYLASMKDKIKEAPTSKELHIVYSVWLCNYIVHAHTYVCCSRDFHQLARFCHERLQKESKNLLHALMVRIMAATRCCTRDVLLVVRADAGSKRQRRHQPRRPG